MRGENVRKAQLSTPMKVVIAAMVLLAVAAILLAIVRPQLFGFSSEANRTIMSHFRDISGVTGG